MQVPGARDAGNPPVAGDLLQRAVPAVRMLLLSCLAAFPVLALLLPLAGFRREAIAMWALVAIVALLYWLLRRGQARAAFFGLVVALIAYAIAATLIYGSIRGSGIYALFGAVFVGGIFFGRGALLATVAASIMVVAGLVLAERAGALGAPPDFSVGPMQWVNHAVVLALLGLNIGFVRSLVVDALGRAAAEIAARRRVEQALGSTEELFSSLFRDSPAALIIIRCADGRIAEVNEAYERIFEVRRAEVTGRRAVEVELWSSAQERDHLVAEIGRDGRIADRRLRLRRRSGVLFDVIVSTATIEWRGEPHYFSTITDVSAEVVARIALEASEERFSKAFNFSPIGLTITREGDGRFIEVNGAHERTLGHARACVLGRTSLEIGSWPSVQERLRFVDLLRRDGRVLDYDTRLRHKSGELADCRLFAERVEVAGESCILTATINVTEQKRQEALILQIAQGVSAETGPEFFRLLASHLGVATGATCVFVAEVGAAAQLFPLACWRDGIAVAMAPKLDATASGLADFLRGGGIRLDPAGAAAYVAAGDPLAVAGMRGAALACLAAPDGTAVGVLCAFAPDAFAEARRVEALFRIFASRAQAELMRMRAERALLEVNLDLEGRVRERTTQLQAANRELEAFSYSVSHDLRSPLRAIDGFLSILVENAAPSLTPDDRDLIDRVLANCARMNALIDDLLDLSRISRIEVARERVDLSAMARAVIQQLQQAQPGRAVRATVAAGLVADCDPALVHIVLTNLLGNAWKFTARTAHASVEFGSLPDSTDQACFLVRDNGAGFDMRYATKLFTPFQRMHRRDEFEGSGIGLVIVERIIARHGGSIEVEAAPGLGATFRFTLSAKR